MEIGDKVIILEDNLYDRYVLKFEELGFKNTVVNSNHFREGRIFGKTVHPDSGETLIAVESISDGLQALVDEGNVYVIERSFDNLTSDEINKLISKKEEEVKYLKTSYLKSLIGQIGLFWDEFDTQGVIAELKYVHSTISYETTNTTYFENFKPLPKEEQDILRKYF